MIYLKESCGGMNQEQRKRIVVVLGMHRSGTSAIARGLKALGVDLGEKVIPPIAGVNEKGFWEDVDINTLDDELLHYLGYDWHTLTPIQQSEFTRRNLASFKLRALELLQEKLKGITVFGLKDPRISRLLPFWKIVFEDLGVNVEYVIVIRHPMSVADSLSKRDDFDLDKSSYLWLGHIVPSMLDSEGYQRVVVDYDLLMEDPERQLCRIAEALSLSFDASSPAVKEYVNEFLTNDLRHTKFHINDLKLVPELPQYVVDAYIFLNKLARDEVSVSSDEVHEIFTTLASRMEEMRWAFSYVARRDAQIETLKRVLDERDGQIAILNRSMSQLLASSSWRLTKPLRFLSRTFRTIFSGAPSH